MAQQSKALASVLEESLQTLVRFQAVSQTAMIGRPIGRRTIGPVSSKLGFGLGKQSFQIRICFSLTCLVYHLGQVAVVNENLFSTGLPG